MKITVSCLCTVDFPIQLLFPFHRREQVISRCAIYLHPSSKLVTSTSSSEDACIIFFFGSCPFCPLSICKGWLNQYLKTVDGIGNIGVFRLSTYLYVVAYTIGSSHSHVCRLNVLDAFTFMCCTLPNWPSPPYIQEFCMFCCICGHCDVPDLQQMSLHKVDNPYLVSFVIRTPIYKWYVIWCGFKNRYQKDVCSNEIGLHAQNWTTFLGSIVNIIGGGPIRSINNEHENFQFINK